MNKAKLLYVIALIAVVMLPMPQAKAGVLRDTLSQGTRQVLSSSIKTDSEVFSQYQVKMSNQRCGITGKIGGGQACRAATSLFPCLTSPIISG